MTRQSSSETHEFATTFTPSPLPVGFFAFLWSRRGELRTASLYRFFSVLAVAPLPLLLQRIVDGAAEEGDLQKILGMTLLFILLLAFHVATCLVSNRKLSEAIPKIVMELRSRVFHKLQFLHFGFLDRTQAGKLLSKYAFDSQKIEMTLTPLLHQIIPGIVLALLITAVLFVLNFYLTLVVLAIVPAVGLMRHLYLRKLVRTNHEARVAQESLSGQANEYISAIKLVRSFGEEQRAVDSVESESEQYRRARASQMVAQQDLGVFGFTSQQLLTVLVIASGAWLVLRGQISVGVLFAFAGSLNVILSPIQLLSQFSQQFFQGRESYVSIRELIASEYVESWEGTTRLPRIRGQIEFENVSFRYEPGSENALDAVSLRVEPGESVALVGHSGSGKSTLVNLLLGLYANHAGRIRIDGVDQRDLDLRAFRRRCAVVMQDNLLLSGSLGENIAFGRPDASEAEIREAAEKANALEFIDELPDGLATRVGERGVALSGGQRQRIAIARAILRDPAILILDEATSALDYESERKIQAALRELARGRTVLTIAHRLSTVMEADRIHVFQNGRIVESGPPKSLANEANSAFAALIQADRGAL